jgi:Fe2+ or Zn2+ uptake regulation protein
MKKDTAEPIGEVIRNAGFRATAPRIALLTYLRKSRTPLLIQEIAAGLKSTAVDQVTVYRMIEAFKKAGIVREVNLHGDRSRYELADTEHDHHHIVCVSCHKVEDFVGCDSRRMERKALQQSHFSKVTGHSFDLYGLCNSCAA